MVVAVGCGFSLSPLKWMHSKNMYIRDSNTVFLALESFLHRLTIALFFKPPLTLTPRHLPNEKVDDVVSAEDSVDAGAHPCDVRMTTRFKESDLTEGLTGAIHETGVSRASSNSLGHDGFERQSSQ